MPIQDIRVLHRLGRSAILWTALLTAGAEGGRAQAQSEAKAVTVGAELRWLPRWEGSRDLILVPLPVFDVRPLGTPQRFRSPNDGFGLPLIDAGQFLAGPVVKVKLPRKENDDPLLRGLGDIGWAVEIGAFAEFWWLPWLRTRTELRQGFGGHKGIAADVITDLVFAATPQLTLSGGPRLALASSAATSPYFGITPIQAAASGLPAFEAKGGVRSFGAGAQARYAFTPQIAGYAFAEYERLTGDAGRSPLVEQRGASDQWMFGIGASYSFDFRW